ncbi:MAG: PIG-L family deacetylase [Chloroflexota bacterium]|nr:MAG: PIG-L family deacetylase [Chloroflexota bacterium]
MFAGERPLFLDQMRIPSTLCIGVLAPHPDDFDAIGVTMRLFHENGNPIHLAVVTSGASGVDDDFCPTPGAAARGALREKEQMASCRFFGLPEGQLSFLRLAEDASGHPVMSAENADLVRRFLLASRPEIVFLPHWNDYNPGHQRNYALFRQIVTVEKLSVVALLNRDPKTIQMRSDVYSVFGEAEAAWKGELLRFHQSQHQRNLRTRQHGIDERIFRVNRQSAEELPGNPAYAEVFELEFF